MIDLTAAVEAMTAEVKKYPVDGTFPNRGTLSWGVSMETLARIAAPLIGEAIAQAIEAQVVRDDYGQVNTFALGELHAARIAREVTR